MTRATRYKGDGMVNLKNPHGPPVTLGNMRRLGVRG